MKVIALLPVKNEDWILDVTIPQLKKFADEILCLDGGSTDSTIAKLTAHGALVRKQDLKIQNYSSWRQQLLDWARERGGTHLVWLDADEAFTTNFLPGFRDRLTAMKPGEKIGMQWLCLWKSPYVYRNDTSVWSNLYKDFIVCDKYDPENPANSINFGTTALHEGRTPGPNEINGVSTVTKIPAGDGAVLHFQFVPFRQFQIKQTFQRCREFVLQTASARRINHKYSATLDDPKAVTTPIPKEWIKNIDGLDAIASLKTTPWYFDAVLKFFKEKGIKYFEPLQIWHIPEFRDMFIHECGREPKPRLYPRWLVSLKNTVNKYVK